MRILLIIILSGALGQAKAQLHGTLQQRVLKDLCITRMDKFEILDSNDSLHNVLLSSETINDFGFIVRLERYSPDGQLTQLYEHDYLFDSIITETRLENVSHPASKIGITKYSYNESGHPMSHKYYNDDRLLSTVLFQYLDSGLLKSFEQTVIGDKRIGSYDGYVTREYIYDSNETLVEEDIKEIWNGKKKVMCVKYKYSADKQMVEKYLKGGLFKRKRQLSKIRYDHKKRIEYEKIYSHDNRRIETWEKIYIYNDRGLIEFEVNSNWKGDKVTIVYQYDNNTAY